MYWLDKLDSVISFQKERATLNNKTDSTYITLQKLKK